MLTCSLSTAPSFNKIKILLGRQIAIKTRYESFHPVDIEIGFNGVAVAARRNVSKIISDPIGGSCSADALSGPKQKREFFQGKRLLGEVSVATTLPANIDYRFLPNGEFFWWHQLEDLSIRGAGFLHLWAWYIL